MKLTAVEWLVEQFETIVFYSEEAKENTIEQAKVIEKEQIMHAYEEGEDNIDSDGCQIDKKGSEQYYNETYGGGKQ